LNQAETALISQTFQAKGYQVVDFEEETDLCVINTCTVTEQSDAKCRQVVRQVLRRSPGAFVAVVGCYAQMAPEALKQIEGVDLIVGTEDKLKVANYVEVPRKLPAPVIIRRRRIRQEEFTLDGFGLYSTTRANLKLQDGCDFLCSFCIIPFARGRARSRNFEDLRREALRLVERGHKEIVLTGVNIGTYRHEGRTLLDVIRMLERIEGLERIRISSIEPTTIPDELIDHMAASGKLCHYFHVPLQSGDDSILQAMRRRHSVRDYRMLIEKIVSRIPDVGLGTDIMVGFPGEGEKEFQNTVRLVEALPFSYLHVFSYSERQGTRSVRIHPKVPPEAKKARSQMMHELGLKKKREFYQRHVGKIVRVLFESRNAEGLFDGLTDNYVKVGTVTPEDLSNRLVDVTVEEVWDHLALGSLVNCN